MARMTRPRINLPNAHTDENDQAKMIRLHHEGRTLREIGEATGWAAGTVRYRLLRLGEKMRPRGRKGALVMVKSEPSDFSGVPSLVLAKGKARSSVDSLHAVADKMFQTATTAAEIRQAAKVKEIALGVK